MFAKARERAMSGFRCKDRFLYMLYKSDRGGYCFVRRRPTSWEGQKERGPGCTAAALHSETGTRKPAIAPPVWEPHQPLKDVGL